jgi:hypothetical protein
LAWFPFVFALLGKDGTLPLLSESSALNAGHVCGSVEIRYYAIVYLNFARFVK